MGELDDKPKEYFEKTKKEVLHKNALAKWVHQHKMQNVDTSDDERKVDQEYQNREHMILCLQQSQYIMEMMMKTLMNGLIS